MKKSNGRKGLALVTALTFAFTPVAPAASAGEPVTSLTGAIVPTKPVDQPPSNPSQPPEAAVSKDSTPTPPELSDMDNPLKVKSPKAQPPTPKSPSQPETSPQPTITNEDLVVPSQQTNENSVAGDPLQDVNVPVESALAAQGAFTEVSTEETEVVFSSESSSLTGFFINPIYELLVSLVESLTDAEVAEMEEALNALLAAEAQEQDQEEGQNPPAQSSGSENQAQSSNSENQSLRAGEVKPSPQNGSQPGEAKPMGKIQPGVAQILAARGILRGSLLLEVFLSMLLKGKHPSVSAIIEEIQKRGYHEFISRGREGFIINSYTPVSTVATGLIPLGPKANPVEIVIIIGPDIEASKDSVLTEADKEQLKKIFPNGYNITFLTPHSREELEKALQELAAKPGKDLLVLVHAHGGAGKGTLLGPLTPREDFVGPLPPAFTVSPEEWKKIFERLKDKFKSIIAIFNSCLCGPYLCEACGPAMPGQAKPSAREDFDLSFTPSPAPGTVKPEDKPAVPTGTAK